jgi:predicted ester cyclase
LRDAAHSCARVSLSFEHGAGGSHDVLTCLRGLCLASPSVVAATGLDIRHIQWNDGDSKSLAFHTIVWAAAMCQGATVSIDIRISARRTLEEIFPAADTEALAEVVHADVVNHELPPGLPQGLQGMQQVMLWLRRAFADLRYEIHQVIAEGDTAVVYCTMRGRHVGEFMGVPPTHHCVDVEQVHIVRFQNGKSIEHWAVRDDLMLMRQLGALSNDHHAGTGEVK